MKRVMIVLISVSFLAGRGVYAQSSEHSWTVRGGLTLSTLMGSGEKVKTSSLIGGQVGIVYNQKISRVLYISPALNITRKGDIRKVTFTPNNETSRRVTSAYWLEVPVVLNCKFPLGERVFMRAGLGPYVAFGMGGKSKYTRPHAQAATEKYTKNTFGEGTWDPEYNPVPDDKKDPLLSGQIWEKGYKRFDYGGTVVISVDFGRFNVGMSSSYGLADIAKPEGITQRNFCNSLTAGWNF